MPGLGSVDGVKMLLQATEGDNWPPDALVRMNVALRLAGSAIEEKTGATFYLDPDDAQPEARLIDGIPVGGKLFLPVGVYSVDSIVANPLTWDGTVWTNGTTLTADQWRLAHQARSGVYRVIVGVDYAFGGDYVITGVWEDQVAGIPDDLHDLTNYIAAELFKKQKASPAGFTGPDQATVPLRDVFKETEVKTTIEKYRVGPMVVF
jgi:hypothetical protein